MLAHSLLLVAAAGAFAAGALATARYFALGVGLTVGAFLLISAPRTPLLSLTYTVGGVSIQGMDYVAVILLGASALRVATGKAAAPRLPVLLLLGLIAFHVVRGVASFGLTQAVNGARPWIWFVIPLIYACTFQERTHVWRLLPAALVPLAVLSAYGYAQSGFQSVRSAVTVDGQSLDPRPLTAAGALLVLQLGLVLASRPTNRPALRTVAIVLVAALLVALQHRTVWVAALVAAVPAASVWMQRLHVRSREGGFAVSGLILLLAPVVAAGLIHSGTLRSSVAETQSQKSTLQWRLESWSSLLREHHDPATLAFGMPAGSSWERELSTGSVTSYSPHSLYVESLLRFGFLGPCLLVWLWALAWRARRNVSGLSAEAVSALLLTQILFGVTYGLSPVEGLLLGALSASAITARRAAQRPARQHTPVWATT